MSTYWSTKAADGSWYTVRGPVPRVGEHVALPEQSTRRVEKVHYAVHRNFTRSRNGCAHVTVILEDPA